MFETVIAFVENLHPVWYFLLLMAAASGLPVSEDALSIWAGGMIGRGVNPFSIYWYIIFIYLGAVFSDLWTFYIGRFANKGVGEKVRAKVFSNKEKADKAMARINKYGDKIGFIQRFCVGARLPLAFLSGFSGISPFKFFLGASLGALFTLPIQLSIGYFFCNQITQVIEFTKTYIGPIVLLLILLGGTIFYKKVIKENNEPVQ